MFTDNKLCGPASKLLIRAVILIFFRGKMTGETGILRKVCYIAGNREGKRMTTEPSDTSFERYRIWPDLNLSVMSIVHTEENLPPVHNHDFYELVLVREGNALHFMNGESVPIRAGDLLLVPPKKKHGYVQPKHLGICNLLFGTDIFESFRSDLAPLPAFQLLFQVQPCLESEMRQKSGLLSLGGEAFEPALALSRQIEDEIHRNQPGGRILTLGLFLTFLTHCLRHARLSGNGGCGNYAGAISGLLAELDHHPEKDWSLELMAHKAGMSLTNFRLHFRNLTGQAPGAYLLTLRLKKAASLLRVTHLSIGEIAYRTGFHDANYFTRQFCRFYGQPPRSYRK